VYRRLGGTRMLLLIAIHPIRVLRMAFQSVVEWLREEWERAASTLVSRATHAEGIFPFVRILSNVIVRELQTMAIVLDVWLGVPVIYSTYMQYDELAHHFGPSSTGALSDLKRTDARIAEIWRMIQDGAPRRYDLVILSDHGMTPAKSYRVLFKESLGSTVTRMMASGPAHAAMSSSGDADVLTSASEDSEYADVGPGIVESVAQMSPHRHRGWRRVMRSVRDWTRSRYGLREIIFPEKYRVDTRHELVVTYSSCLALIYFDDSSDQLEREDIMAVPRRAFLYRALLAHPGIGLVATRSEKGVELEGPRGRAVIARGSEEATVLEGENPLATYGTSASVVRAVRDLILQPNSGDMVLFGAYDGYDIVSFDDQVGAHGSAGGDQVYPFIITPPDLDLGDEVIEDARDVHRVVMERYV
jgi:Uncharacterized proteins of the AP superfamily